VDDTLGGVDEGLVDAPEHPATALKAKHVNARVPATVLSTIELRMM
jgi:hypothetical protein